MVLVCGSVRERGDTRGGLGVDDVGSNRNAGRYHSDTQYALIVLKIARVLTIAIVLIPLTCTSRTTNNVLVASRLGLFFIWHLVPHNTSEPLEPQGCSK